MKLLTKAGAQTWAAINCWASWWEKKQTKNIFIQTTDHIMTGANDAITSLTFKMFIYSSPKHIYYFAMSSTPFNPIQYDNKGGERMHWRQAQKKSTLRHHSFSTILITVWQLSYWLPEGAAVSFIYLAYNHLCHEIPETGYLKMAGSDISSWSCCVRLFWDRLSVVGLFCG